MIPVVRPHRKPDFSLATINIVFLLLLFFLTVGTIVERDELAIAAPETSELPLDRLPRPLLLVDEDGNLALDGQPVPRSLLASRVAQAMSAPNASGGAINILAPRDSSAQVLVGLIDELGSVGVEIRIVTLRVGQ